MALSCSGGRSLRSRQPGTMMVRAWRSAAIVLSASTMMPPIARARRLSAATTANRYQGKVNSGRGRWRQHSCIGGHDDRSRAGTVRSDRDDNLYDLAHQSDAYVSILEDQTGVQHACEAETSMMLAAFADCVRTDRIGEAFNPRGVQKDRKIGNTTPPLNRWRSFSDIAPTGVMGDARKATAVKGERLLDVAAELLAARLIDGQPWSD
jgi:creatinine amidohydrolase/Fe(II)-dependent formamide hydrolase-like protein